MADKKNIRKGWVDPYNYNQNTIFDEDYEEPTYLSFKLEFGNWGASINSLEADKLIWESQSIKYNSYDDIPMGLFNPNFTIPNAENPQSGVTNFNLTEAYSAVDYLYRNNEDTRAEYLQAFIKGWYDLQKNYQPYFQEISGLNGLFEVNLTRGSRIGKAGAKLTIKCLEDTIDQRIRYLLTLYKKAAWDDLWQRWILPDIYRYFHLYIYISENRIFHTSKSSIVTTDSDNVNSEEIVYSDFNNTEILTKMLENITADNYARMSLASSGVYSQNFNEDIISTNTNNFVLTALNGFAPVTVLDCGPCEFDIESIKYNDTYTINQKNIHDMTFNIIVKNVKFYERNPLMWRLKTDEGTGAHDTGMIFVKDLFNVHERTDFKNTLASMNDYISQSFYNNDEVLSFIEESTGDNPELGDHFKAVRRMLSLYDIFYEQYGKLKYSTATYNPEDGDVPQDFEQIFASIEQYMYEQYRNAAALRGITALNFEKNAQDLWLARESDLRDFYNRQWILYEDLLHNYEYFDEIWRQTLGDRSWATDLDGGPWGRLQGADLRAWIPRQNLAELDLESNIEDQNLIPLDLTSDIPDQNMTPLDLTVDIPDQNMVRLRDFTAIPEQNLIGIEQPADRSWATDLDGWNDQDDSNNNLADLTDIYEDQKLDITFHGVPVEQPKDRSWATDLDGWSSKDDSDKDAMPRIKDTIKIPNQNMTPMDDTLEIPEQNLIPLIGEEYEYSQNMTPLKGEKYKSYIRKVTVSGEAEPAELKPVTLEEEPYNPTFVEVPLDDTIDLPDMNMVPMEYNEYTPNIKGFTVNAKSPTPEIKNVFTDMTEGATGTYEKPEIKNVSPDMGDYTGPKISKDTDNANIQKNSLQSFELLNGTYNSKIKPVSVELENYQNPEIKNIEVELTNTPPGNIKDIELESPSNIPQEIKNVHVDTGSYINPPIKNIELESGTVQSTIKNVNIEQPNYQSPEIKNINLELAGNTPPKIKNIQLEDGEYNPVLKPVFIEEKIQEEPIIKNISLETPVHPDTKILNVEVENKKYTFTGDLTKLEYTDYKKPGIKEVTLEKSNFQNIQDMTFMDNTVTQKEPLLTGDEKSIYPETGASDKIIKMEKLKPEEQTPGNLLHNIAQLQKEQEKLKKETEELKNNIKKKKMTGVSQPVDRSWATDLDGWHPKDDSDKDAMISMQENNKIKNNHKRVIKEPKVIL